MAADDKVVIGQTHAADDAEAVLIGYLLGVEALRAGKQALMWLTKDGVHLPPRATPTTSWCLERRRSKTFTPSTSTKAAGSSPARSVSRHTVSKQPNGYKAPKSKAPRRCTSSPQAEP